MLEVRGLEIAYGAVRALRGLSLDAQAGRIVAVLGANGAGKSSLLRAIAGLAPVAAGSLAIAGRPLAGLSPQRRARLGLGYAMEGRRLFRNLTVAENLSTAWHFGARSQPLAAALSEVYAAFPILGQKRAVAAGLLSGGQQQMLILSSVTIRRPGLLLLDEPSLGLAPIIVNQIYDFIQAYARERQAAVLFTEQMAALALSIADHCYVLRQGRLVAEGPRERFAGAAAQQSLSEAYF